MPEEILKWRSILFPEKVDVSFTEYGKRQCNGLCECEIDCEDCSHSSVCLKLTDNRTDIEYQMDVIAFDMAWWETFLMDKNKENPDTVADAIVKLIGCQMQLDILEQKRQMAS